MPTSGFRSNKRLTFSNSYFRVYTAQKDDAISFGDDFAEVNACEIPDEDLLRPDLLAVKNEAGRYNSQIYTSQLANLLAKKLKNPSEASGSNAIVQPQRRISGHVESGLAKLSKGSNSFLAKIPEKKD